MGAGAETRGGVEGCHALYQKGLTSPFSYQGLIAHEVIAAVTEAGSGACCSTLAPEPWQGRGDAPKGS